MKSNQRTPPYKRKMQFGLYSHNLAWQVAIKHSLDPCRKGKASQHYGIWCCILMTGCWESSLKVLNPVRNNYIGLLMWNGGFEFDQSSMDIAV